MLSAADRRHLLRAVALSRAYGEGRGRPFGAVIVRDDAVLAERWNQVVSTNDPTAHAEVAAIRRACQLIWGTFFPSSIAASARAKGLEASLCGR